MPSFGQLFVSIGANIEGISKGFDDTEKSIKKFSRDLNKLGRDFTDLGGRLTVGLTVPLAALGTAGVAAFSKFDAAMTQSLAIMGDVSDELQRDMANAAREMAKSTTFSAEQAAQSFFFLASAGLDARASIEALPVVAKFAQAGMFDMARATDLLTDAQSALGLTIRNDAVANMENMARVSDVLVKANNLANASVEQFSESLTNKAGAALRALGKDVEEGVAVLAAFADQGIKGEEAGTQLGIVLRDLQTQAIANRDNFEALGLRVFDSSGEMRNMGDIIANLEEVLAGMSDEQKRVTLGMLGFSDRSVAATQVLLGTSDAIKQYESGLRLAAGTTEEVANKQLTSFSAQMNLLRSRIEDSAISLGASLVPILRNLGVVLEPVLGFLEGAVRWFSQLPSGVQATAIAVAGLAAATGPVLFGLGQLAFAANNLITLFPALASQAAAMGGSMAVAKTAVIGLGQAAVIAGAAFAAWKLGEWAAQNIPLVAQLGDGLLKVLDPLDKLPGLLSGADAAQASLQQQTEALAKSLKDKFGVEIERGNKSLQDWSKELRKAATELTGADKKTDEIRKSLAKTTTETNDVEKALKRFNAALEKSERGLDDLEKPLRFVARELTEVERKTELNRRAWEDLTGKAVEPAAEALRSLETDIQNVASTALSAVSDFERMTGALSTQVLTVSDADKAALRLGDAYGVLGVKSQAVADRELRALSVALEEIRKQAAEGNPDALEKLAEAEKVYADRVKGSGGPVEAAGLFKGALQSVSTVITDLGKDIAERFTEKIKTGIGIVDDFAAAFIRLASEKYIGAAIKALGELLDFIPGLRQLSGILFGGTTAAGGAAGAAGSATGAAGQAAGTVGGVAGSAGGAGSAAGGALSTASMVTGIVTGIVSAVTGVIGVFQNARQETTLNAIEENTRRGTLFLGDRGDQGILGTQFRIAENSDYIVGNTDEIKATAWDIRGLLQGFAATGIMVAGLSTAPQAGAASIATFEPTEFAGAVSRGVDLSQLRTEFEAAQRVATDSLDELHQQTAQLESIQDAIEAQGPSIVINIENVNGTDSRAVEAFMKEVERRLRVTTKGVR